MEFKYPRENNPISIEPYSKWVSENIDDNKPFLAVNKDVSLQTILDLANEGDENKQMLITVMNVGPDHIIKYGWHFENKVNGYILSLVRGNGTHSDKETVEIALWDESGNYVTQKFWNFAVKEDGFDSLIKGFVTVEEIDKLLSLVSMVLEKPQWLRGGN